MHKMILRLATAAFALALAAVSAAASDQADVIMTVKQYAEAFNNADRTAFLKFCAPEAAIIDVTPPHVWRGPTACRDWWNAFMALDQKQGVSAERMEIGEPKPVVVAGGRAYLVTPATFSFQLRGKASSDDGLWTVTLQKLGSAWRITGWTWSQQRPPCQDLALQNRSGTK